MLGGEGGKCLCEGLVEARGLGVCVYVRANFHVIIICLVLGALRA